MSRLWSRLGARTAAVALLSVGVAGGFYLGENRETQQQGLAEQVSHEVDRADLAYQRERQATHQVKFAQQRAAEYQAKLRAAQAAKEAAERARRAEAAAASRKRERDAANAPTKPYDGPIPASCEEYSGNRKIGCALMIDSGFGIAEFPCLEKLWNKESGWNHKARNSSSGAYGIPQAYPGNKMSAFGDDWQTNPATQIKWGLSYIKGRYKTPCGAWTYFQNNNHY
ncbi:MULTISPECIES: transglycosylase SLT domain-containing protein [unclassified Micromonospora]|uniref:aggregation-promoting factor C-terminal-like domain-containing protein n=1 Tax=unclassified Micromonospora TaxID=2617518 RepID=UPI00249A6339|nr:MULTISPECIES: transglycosylase SLT domain-containing protein [unclassified Micromonospora]WFE50280.1 transglycosylase SLT domain-containing protein [Micromonospora sp. WMMD1155]WFF02907.1 transglycosylase SLT domain-containing protein [Micromonospora sp. WMMD964]